MPASDAGPAGRAPHGARSTKRPAQAGRFAVRLALPALLAAAALPAAADPAAAPWLPYRDANPFVAAGGLPFAPPAAAPDRWRVDVLLQASNTELAFDRGAEHLVYDAEVHELRVAVTRALGERWLLRASLGAVRFDRGFLDGFIEDFHRAFGFGNGDRGRLGTDGHAIRYGDGRERVLLDRSQRGIAPLMLDLAWRMPAGDHEWLAGATLKLPTSHAHPLIDDRATDVSLWLAAQSADAATRLPWGARVGVMQRGNTRLLPGRAEDRVPFADAALGYVLHPGWDVAAQLQWHGAPYDSEIPFLACAATLTLSTGWRAASGWMLRAGLVEDAIPRHAQDVTFFVGLTL
jgi:hypothetical protein